MEFTHNDREYRLERGTDTLQWLLLKRSEHSPTGWTLMGVYPASIDDIDIIDHSKNVINENDRKDKFSNS